MQQYHLASASDRPDILGLTVRRTQTDARTLAAGLGKGTTGPAAEGDTDAAGPRPAPLNRRPPWTAKPRWSSSGTSSSSSATWTASSSRCRTGAPSFPQHLPCVKLSALPATHNTEPPRARTSQDGDRADCSEAAPGCSPLQALSAPCGPNVERCGQSSLPEPSRRTISQSCSSRLPLEFLRVKGVGKYESRCNVMSRRDRTAPARAAPGGRGPRAVGGGEVGVPAAQAEEEAGGELRPRGGRQGHGCACDSPCVTSLRCANAEAAHREKHLS